MAVDIWFVAVFHMGVKWHGQPFVSGMLCAGGGWYLDAYLRLRQRENTGVFK